MFLHCVETFTARKLCEVPGNSRPNVTRMVDPYVVETHRRLAVHSPMRTGFRVFLGLIALFPLLAPYELIIRPQWESYLNPFFLFAAAIALGALAVSAGFAWGAIAGVSSLMIFNKANKTFTYIVEAPAIRRREYAHPLRQVRSVEVATHESGDSGPSYALRVGLESGEQFESASSFSLPVIEDVRDCVVTFLDA